MRRDSADTNRIFNTTMAGDHGNVHVVNSKQLWETKIEDAKSRGKIIVVDFTATWCGPCRLMAPVFSELSKKYDILIFLKVDVDEVQEVTTEWEIRAMPTFLFIKDGKQIDKIVGANKAELEKKCHHYATNQSGIDLHVSEHVSSSPSHCHVC